MASKISEMVEGQCQLCLGWGELKDSHILPRHLWRRSGITGSGRQHARAIKWSGQIVKTKVGDGISEHLCCGICEGRMNRWETYAANYLFEGKFSPFMLPAPLPPCYGLIGLDYKPFKLYLLSFLWKMGASKHPERFFSQVNLGPHQERLRKKLLAEDPGEPWQYYCIASILTFDGHRFSGFFQAPRAGRQDGRTIYRLVAAGIALQFEVCAAAPTTPGLHPPQYLGREGNWIVPVQDARELHWIQDSLERAHRALARSAPPG